MGILYAVRDFQRRVDVVALRDGDDLAIDLHLSLAADEIVVLVERTFLVTVVEKMDVNALARAGRKIIDDEVRRRGRAVEAEELDLALALAFMDRR